MRRRLAALIFALACTFPASRADADEPASAQQTAEDLSEASFLPPAVVYGGLCLLVALGAGIALSRRR